MYKNSHYLSFDTAGGLVWVRAEDISMFRLPPLRYFLSFRGWGAVLILKNGRTIHIKETPEDVKAMLKNSMEE